MQMYTTWQPERTQTINPVRRYPGAPGIRVCSPA